MSLQSGMILNQRYRIERLLGHGGLGEVYLAWDLDLDAPVAVKKCLDGSPAAEAQFRIEAGLLYRLHHPNLPRAHHCFSDPQHGMFLTMDYIEGESLFRKVSQFSEPPSLAMALNWISPIFDALAYLHRQQPPVIHRDIKPDNIIVRSDGCPFLVDFGVSKVFDPVRKTVVGARAVTQGYSPPEQYGPATTDERSDIYALGATLYYLLTGREPPSAEDLMSGRVTLAWPHTVNPDVPPAVGHVVMKALELDRTQRWSSVNEFYEALLEAAKVPPEKIVRRFPWKAAAAGGFVILVLAAGALWAGGIFPPKLNSAAPSPSQAVLSTGAARAQSEITPAVRRTNTARPAATPSPRPRATRTSRPASDIAPKNTSSSPPSGAEPGETWTRAIDGMVMVYVPAGEFAMGAAEGDVDAQPDEKPRHSVWLDAFWIDRTEVTNAMFQTFTKAVGYTWPGPAVGEATHPVVNVTWNEASAYCHWAGGSLPSEAQWEKAARGTDERLFPWGNQTATCKQAVMAEEGFGCGRDSTWPVGSKSAGASPYGVLDMAGNVWEWTLDWYGEDYYNFSPSNNPAGIETGSGRVLRGGSLLSGPRFLRASYRGWNNPWVRKHYDGFRCVQ